MEAEFRKQILIMRRRYLGFLVGGCVAAVVLLVMLFQIKVSTPAKSTKELVELAALPQIERAIEVYRKMTGSYPSTNEGLSTVTAFFKANNISKFEILDRPVDPWGSDYQYRQPSETPPYIYDLWSLGPDRVQSRDDIWAAHRPKFPMSGSFSPK